ncbi:MAG: cupredoxin domain-containing protein [Candidatus Sungbacteria bacterium]|nr:cupredoxin domain-containing protein [Candidatus Sungbacteria bacterium]
MHKQNLNKGFGLTAAIIVVALAFIIASGSYLAIKRQAEQARETQEKALSDGDAKLKEMRMMRSEMMGDNEGAIKTDTGKGMMVPGYEGMMSDKEVTHLVNLTATNFAFSQSLIRVKKGEKIELTFEVTQGFHNFVVDEFKARTKQMNAGGKETIEFIVNKAGTFEYYCSVGSHRQMGMKGKLVVE